MEFHAAPGNSIVLRVEARDLACDDSGLRMLFALGCRVFLGPQTLQAFANGPLAAAFGIRVEEPDPPPTGGGELTPPASGDEVLSSDPSGVDDELAPPIEHTSSGTPPSAALRPERLARRLSRVVSGQAPALERVAFAVCAQLAKQAPTRPSTILLLGPTGTGKTSTVEALPNALKAVGYGRAHVFRVDCNELTEAFQVSRLIGAPPGYVGYGDSRLLFGALETEGCILLLDEIDRAHPSVLEDVLFNLLDTGRLTAPDGRTVNAAHAVIVMTSNVAADELAARLHRIAPENRWAVERECRGALTDAGLPAALVARIGTFAVYQDLDSEALRQAAQLAIRGVVREYGLRVRAIEPVITDVVLDIAGEGELGVRALNHVAQALLADALIEARARNESGPVTIEPGPPISVRGR